VFEWHLNEECDLEFIYEHRGERAYFCHTHHQWTGDHGRVVFVFTEEQDARKTKYDHEGPRRPKLTTEIGRTRQQREEEVSKCES
jgi:hypothetical protein